MLSEAQIIRPAIETEGFYSTSQVSRLTRIPTSTLYEWRRRGIIRPSLELVECDMVADNGYSYSDMTLIRIIKALRDKHLDFDSAAKAIRHLYERLGPPDRRWVNEKVYIVGNHIYVDRPDPWQITDATQMGQKVMEILFGDLFEELREVDEEASIIVPPQFRKYVQVKPGIMGGEPVVRDTRIPTATLVALLANHDINELKNSINASHRKK
jgi:DNA-binding transcriptional MerR regulator